MDVPKYQDETKDSKYEYKQQDNASSVTPTESEFDKQQEEARIKHNFEQGEGSRTIGLQDGKMDKLVETIINVVNENCAKFTQHEIGYFHWVSQLLQNLTNGVTTTRIP